MLHKYNNRVVNYDEDKKKDAGDKGGDDEFPSVENAFFIFGGPTCDVECIEHAEALALDDALAAQLQGMAEEAMDSKQRHAGNFEPAVGTKDVPLDPKTPDSKALKISASLDSK
ncbi:uncharacterized protein LOC120681242 [Panicum virgatum]|uniref:uncharacterized protein LOC120681242 n=1 Tax=Panicum virgatum TaxID=38727 RepID=UPI0019D51C00|nr:uncharacterized protein LOC120681242 [Panicum virgatum]